MPKKMKTMKERVTNQGNTTRKKFLSKESLRRRQCFVSHVPPKFLWILDFPGVRESVIFCDLNPENWWKFVNLSWLEKTFGVKSAELLEKQELSLTRVQFLDSEKRRVAQVVLLGSAVNQILPGIVVTGEVSEYAKV